MNDKTNDQAVERIAKFSPEQQRLLLQKLRKQKKSAHTKKHQLPEIVPVSREQAIPLSFAQQQLWLIDQIEGGSSHYNEFTLLEIKESLIIPALQQSLTEIVKRHEILRTIFQKANEAAVQVIMPPSLVLLPIIDLQGLPISVQETEIHQLSATEAQQPFDLAKGPLFRFTLLQLKEKSYVLFITMHHIICDAWGSGLLAKEMETLYKAFAKDLPSPLPALPIQYADFAYWQRQWLSEDVLQPQLKYWQQQLVDIPTLLELPTDKPRPPVQSFRGKKQVFDIKPEILEKLQKLSQQSKTSLFMLLLASFVTLLYRYTGQEDIVVGYPTANRNQPALEPLIGHFVNILVLRTKLSNHPRFTELLAQVKQVTLDAYAHQELPFEQLVEILKPERSRSYNPLFQVMFVFQNIPVLKEETQWIGDQPLIQARFDLTMELEEIQGQLNCLIKYNTDLFETDTISRMIGHFQTLLVAIVTHPTQFLTELPLLTEIEQQQLLAWNQTQTDYPFDQTIVDLFQAQVEKTPDNIAVVFENQQRSYKELNLQSNQLAYYLLNLTGTDNGSLITDNCLVGICVERSVELVIGLLGILKAGGAYVPLDPDYPKERLHFMLEDSRVKVLLSQSHQLSRLPVSTAKVVCLDSEWEQIAAASPGVNPVRLRSPEDLAYVIYTSGSTGVPKGVMVTHKGFFNLSLFQKELFNVTEISHILQFASLSFDATCWELAMTIPHGAEFHLSTADKLLPSDSLITLLKERRISHITLPPSALAVLPPETLPHLQFLVVAGEACSSELVEKWSTGRKFINAYGPTESTVCATLTECQTEGHSPPIGKPIANTQIYILDVNHNPTPLGIPGELCIAGRGLAKGYLNRPDLTAEKFIEVELFGQNQRIYKTGDLARWLPDGNLKYLGRIDHQVKLRGFRIELSEIEVSLSQHEAVKEAVVVLYNKDDNPRLVAYVTMVSEPSTVSSSQLPTDDKHPSTSGNTNGQTLLFTDNCSLITELRTWLKTRLPEYMLPASVTVLDKLPLTPNGKINRKALPAPDLTIQTAQQAPRTETERLLCNLWSQVLGIEVTSILSHFFEAGGHSLLATQLVSRLRESFGVEMPLPVIFELPLLHEQAGWLDNEQRGSELPPIIPRISGEPLVLSFAQQRLWFLTQLEGPSATYSIPAALHLTGQLNETALQQALTALVQRHDSLRLCFPAVDGEATVQWGNVYNPLSLTDLSEVSETSLQRQITEWIVNHTQTPFDLGTGPLLSLRLLKLGHQEQILLFNMHHIISDGWSIGVLLRSLSQLYNAYVQNPEFPEPQLPTLPIQYTDFAAWQRNWLQGEVLEQQLAYWLEKLVGIPELLELPTDYPRSAVMRYQGKYLQSTLDSTLTRGIKQLSQQQGVTVFMSLLATFQVLLYRYSGQTDLVVGSPIANRTHHQTENLIGFFVNTLVLRTQINEEQTFSELLKQVRKTALEAYSHQDIPFEYLVEQINPSRSLSYSPLFQVMFAFQNAPEETLELSGLTMSFLEPEQTTAKFDLTLSVTEQDDVLVCDWEYNTDLFRSDTITLMTEHFQVLLEGIVNHSEQSLSQLPLLTEAEQQQLLAWNQTQIDYPKDQTIVDLFQVQVEKTPDNIAVVFENQQLSYKELNLQSNQIAHYLLNLTGTDNGSLITDNCLVGICVERSVDLVIGLLGILKAGGAYVPLDPDYPKERLRFMLEDSGVKVLLSQSHQLSRLPVSTAKVVCLDSEWEQIAAASPRVNPVRLRSPEDLAYVIYTSGSTGVPKGVMVTHQGFFNLSLFQKELFNVTEISHILQFASLSFDATCWELAMTIPHGAQFHLSTADKLLPSESLITLLKERRISHITLPPSALAVLPPETLPHLQFLVVAGEACSSELVEKWSTGRKFINAYGPTESTVCATLTECQTEGHSPPIGKPIANTQIYILDVNHNPTPLGIPGELCIAGRGLARGYLNRPDLTAEKFIEVELFGQNQRIYKTGDLARWLPDGNLEYLGRLDHQVKLRGFRIELGEIEATLSQHEAVKETVVVLYNKDDNPRLAAYVTLDIPIDDVAGVLRTWLKTRLPEYMLPTSVMVLDKLPLTPNGKIDRKGLPAPDVIQNDADFIKPQTTVEQQIAEIWIEVLKLEKVGIHDNFFDLGGHSLLLLQVQSRLQALLTESLPAVKLFQYPTIQSLAAYLTRNEPEKSVKQIKPTLDDSRDIAIIGMAGRFPGSQNIDIFWNNLRHGLECIQFFTDQELLESGVDPTLLNDPDYVKAGSVLEDAELFDALFFGYTPKEAEILDPQQRLFLEIAWTAIEYAGYDVASIHFPVGVFAGAGMSTYFINNLLPNKTLVETLGDYQITLGDKDFIATRTAYKLNLKGPALTIHTACSTSLVAVHVACQSLLNGECEMALAGGVSVSFPQTQGYLYEEGMIASPDGHCRAFDAAAQGTVGGAGVGVVVLKRLSRAMADGDSIHAVIKGTAINNDGMDKVGFTAPSVDGQVSVIKEAMQGLDYESISYVEAHGTGTVLGDPIEISALTQAYQTQTQKTNYCALGSVKTNVGHLDTAAGVAGLIKTVLALKHREIPPSLHFKNPNPQIDFANSPFFVNTELRLWQSPTPIRAGVSSFGIGGTNAHVVVEEAPVQTSSESSRNWQLLCLSAKTENALKQYSLNLSDYIATHSELNLADVAYTLNLGRKAFTHRGFLIGENLAEVAEILRNQEPKDWQQSQTDDKALQVVFMFPGQGAQYVNMAVGLYKDEPEFRAIVDECARLLKPIMELDLRELLYHADETIPHLEPTQIAQPALFVTEYALAKLYMSWGIKPIAMIGHSIGEYVAACLAGVLSLEDALKLVATRGRLMQSLPTGAMLSVRLSAAEIQPWLTNELSLAAHNAPNLCVVSGTTSAIETLANQLEAQSVECRRLYTSHAFHSSMMEPILAVFREQLTQVKFNPPQIPYISNLSGTWITATQPMSQDYWCQHLRQTVRFSEGLQVLLENTDYVYLEMGPGRALATLARQHQVSFVFNALREATFQQEDVAFLLTTLGKLWLAGFAIDWSGFYAQQSRQRLPLPTYPFERQRYWIEAADTQLDVLSVKSDRADWFYIPIWQRERAPFYQPHQTLEPTNWLVFTDKYGLGSQLVKRLEQAHINVTIVCPGSTFSVSEQVYTLNPSQTDDYETLFNELATQDKLPTTLVHLWSVTSDPEPLSDDSYHKTQQLGFYSLLYIARALWKHSVTTEFQLEVVSNQIQAVTGEEYLYPEKATVLGPVKVIPQEYPNLKCRSIDIVIPKSGPESKLVDQLLAEFTTEHDNNILPIAFRGPYRWQQSFTAQRLEKPEDRTIGLRKNGVYLITGGLGGLGLVFAEYLAKTVQAKLVLVSRSKLPAKEEWAQLLSNNKEQPISSPKPPRIMLDLATEEDVIHQMETTLKTELGVQALSSGLEATLNELCSSYLYGYLARHINTERGQVYNQADLKEQLKILPKFDKFYHLMLKMLAEDSLIKAEAGQIEFLKESTAIKDAEQLRIAAEQSYPDFGKTLAYLDHCVSHYHEALTGEIEAISVLYPQGRTYGEETKDNTQKSAEDLYITLLRDIIAKVIENSPGKKIKILEVGAGNGFLTYSIVPILNGYTAEYHFTDLGKFFVVNAEKQADKMGINRLMHFGVLDISKDPNQQGYDSESFDMILGLNVVHATKNISETLGHLKKLLVPQGLLCLIEMVKQQRWVDMIWGLAEGWWYFEDEELRTHSPLLNIPQWENVLEQQGFQSIKAYPSTLPPHDETDCALIIAQEPNLMTDFLLEPGTVLDETQRLQYQIRCLTALEAYGSEIMVLSADVADFAQMQSVYMQAIAQFGEIHGVIHAAAIEGGGTIQVQATEMAEQEFAPKIKGTRTLEKVFKPTKLDFMMLCSSQNAIYGSEGQVGYSAANAFLDAYAHAKAIESNTLTFSINWDRWQNIGMAAKVEAKHLARTGEVLTGGLTAEEGFQAFSRILSKQTLSQVIVSKRDFINFIKYLTPASVKEATEEEIKAKTTTSTHVRPSLPNAYLAPRSKVEQIITDLWQEMLGIKPIGVYDDFYDLGGDSLIATRVISHLRKSLEVELAVRDLFEKTTVAALAQYLTTSLIAPVSNENLNDYLEEEEL